MIIALFVDNMIERISKITLEMNECYIATCFPCNVSIAEQIAMYNYILVDILDELNFCLWV